MKARLRWGLLLGTAGLWLAPASALAQSTSQPVSNTPATDAVGPRELQNFSLPGTVTKPATQAPAPQTASPSRTQRAAPAPSQAPSQAAASTPASRRSATPQADQPRRAETVSAEPAPQTVRAPEPLRQSQPANSVTVALPRLGDAPRANAAAPMAAGEPGFAPEADPPVGNLAPENKLPLLPWLLATLALGLGAGFLFWRNRSREAFSGGPQLDAFTAPEPAPRAVPAPPKIIPAKAAPLPPSIPGVVSTRLRPWIEIGFQPLRCVLNDEQVVIEFELDLFNSGSAPARAVLAEATLFNAGPDQDRDVRAFFENPVGQGERIVAIPPLKRVTVRTKVVASRAQIQPYELAGKQVFVPVIAFNALYRWGGGQGQGQTSSSYLLGRDTKGEKMTPFRLDLGPRIFRAVGARLLPAGVRS